MTQALTTPTTGTPAETGPDGTLLFHPDRPLLKKRPLKAWGHFRELLKDKENTAEVFNIFESLPSTDVVPRARAFNLSEEGQRIRASEPYLPTMLDDHDALRKLPDDSVAHSYLHFMESQGLSAAGLVAEYDSFVGDRQKLDDLFIWYMNRYRDTHDLLHVLTGYSRDALGEQCVLAFTHGQNGGLGNLFIAYAGGYHMRKTVQSKAPVIAAIREAQKQGRACPRIADMPIRELLARPLDEVRKEFNITPPVTYKKCHAVWKSEGIDPYNLLLTTDKKAA